MRITLGFLAVALAACGEPVLHGLDEASANNAVLLLQAERVDAAKHTEGDGFVVEVPAAQTYRALAILRNAGLPRPKISGLDAAAKTDSVLPSELSDRARLIEGYDGEVRRALFTLDGVVDAQAIVVLGQEGDAMHDATPAKAAVIVRYERARGAPISEQQLRAFVAHSVPNLDAANVSVVFSEAQPVAVPDAPASMLSTRLALAVAAVSVLISTVLACFAVFRARAARAHIAAHRT